GYLDQFPVRNISLQLNVKQNLEYALILRQSLSKEERKKLILETSDNFEIKELLDKQTLTLSGGELQKLSLATSTVFNPTVLLCDEPTSQLDETSKCSIMNVISDFVANSSILVIFATHDLSLIDKQPTYEIKQGGLVKCQ
ncbi:ATP-binding cassette domain-containing protein, partial [Candidatus Heimdallarchaeota archaeon]